ncbi:hypothetical protein SY88_16320 [Clostridiales bacterium PH28_bin88]|nr:hypothetical protein SY88_16320 [Clostridiales bacterium PH28_bin88]
MAQPSVNGYTRRGPSSYLKALFGLMRPRQWIKNGLVLTALLFPGEFFTSFSLWLTVAAFFAFCLASSGIYCINDAIDAGQDRLHPRKRSRPVASGAVSAAEAVATGTGLSAAALFLGFAVAQLLGLVILAYLIINLLYCTWFKRVVLLDVMSVAAGFVLRAAGGVAAIDVEMSKWFLAWVMLLSLFLAVAKRRHEVTTLDEADSHRGVLAEYPLALLDQLTAVLSGAVIVTYLLYVMESHRPSMFFLTSPLVTYGVFRYLYLVHRRTEGGSPDETLLSDWPLLATVVLWGVTSAGIIYLSRTAPFLD